MTALPADLQHQDPLDPERILRELPERERENFLSQYREALDGARDPAGWKHLRRVLRLWNWMVIAAGQPGHYEAREQALAGTGEGMLLEDYIRLRRQLDRFATEHAKPRERSRIGITRSALTSNEETNPQVAGSHRGL